MKCIECEVYYSAYLDGELDDILRSRFESHLEDCGKCREEVRQMKVALAALRGLPAEEKVPGFEQRVAASLQGNSIPIVELMRSYRSWGGRAVAVAAMLLLVFGMGFVLARFSGGTEDSLDQKLMRMGMRKVDGSWVPLEHILHAREGMVFIDNAWRPREDAAGRLFRERGYRRDQSAHWVHADDLRRLHKGLVRSGNEWRSPGQVAETVMRAQGLVRDGTSWVTPEQKIDNEQQQLMLKEHWVFVDGDWLSPDEYDERILKREGLVKLEGGGWERRENLEKSRLGFIRVNEEWIKPDRFVAQWLRNSGYELAANGRWRDSSQPADRNADKHLHRDELAWRELPEDKTMLARVEISRAQRRRLRHLRAGRVRGRFSRSSGVQFSDFDPKNGIDGWRIKFKHSSMGQALGTPAVAYRKIFIGGGMNSTKVYAFDAEQGRFVWGMSLKDNGPSNPIVGDNNVYYATESCTFYALKTKSGRKDWSRYLAGILYSMPMISNGNVVISFPGGAGYVLAAFDSRAGAMRWVVPLPGDSFVGPNISDNRVFLATRAGTVHCYDLTLGNLIWARDIHALTTPTVIDERQLLVRRAVRLDVQPDPRYYRKSAVYGEVVSILDARTGETLTPMLGSPKRLSANSLKELFPDRNHFEKRLVLREGQRQAGEMGKIIRSGRVGAMQVEGNLCFATRGNSLEAIDVVSNKRKWVVTLEAAVPPAMNIGGSYLTHTDPCVAGGKVFVGTLKGRLLCVDAQSGQVDWAENIGSPIGNYASPRFSMMQVQPIVVNGRIYVTTLKGELVCIDTGDRTLDGPHMWGDKK